MRPLIALIVASVILGSVSWFIKSQSRVVTKRAVHETEFAEGRFDLEITLTFDAGPDAFAIRSGQAPSLIVEQLGETVLKRTDEVSAGTPIVVKNVSKIVLGKNSFVVRCTARDSDALVARAIRVRVLRDDKVIADETIWSPVGEPCEGIVELDVGGKMGSGTNTNSGQSLHTSVTAAAKGNHEAKCSNESTAGN